MRRAVLLGVLACTVALAACGGSSHTQAARVPPPATSTPSTPPQGAPTAQAPSTTTTSVPRSPSSPATPTHHHHRKLAPSTSRALTAFTACMRAHGIAAFPEPVGEGFNLTHVHIDPTTAPYRTAERACNPLLQAIDPRNPSG